MWFVVTMTSKDVKSVWTLRLPRAVSVRWRRCSRLRSSELVTLQTEKSLRRRVRAPLKQSTIEAQNY